MTLSAHNLTFAYGETPVLADVNLELRPGEPAVLAGSSGGGKTTLLRLLAGLETPQAGEVIREGRVSFVFQEDRLFPQLTVWENLRLVSPSLSRDQAEAALEALAFPRSLDLFPDQLSGGMARRVSLCRGLLFPAQIYLLDEPFRGLDEETHRLAREEIGRRCRGKILLAVSHDREDAPALGARLLLMEELSALPCPERRDCP